MSLRNDDVHPAERLKDEDDDDDRRPAGVALLGSVGVADDDDMPESEENCRRLAAPPPPHLAGRSPGWSQTSTSSSSDENVSSMYDTNRDSEPLATDRSGVDGGVCGNEHADRRSASFAHSSSMSDVDMRSEERRSSSSGKQPATNLGVFSLQTDKNNTITKRETLQFSKDTLTFCLLSSVRVLRKKKCTAVHFTITDVRKQCTQTSN